MKQFRLLTLLVLLAAVVSGAWATTPNSIVINGTPQVGDKSISLTYHFDPANVPGITSFVPTLKVKCAADNKWDETNLSLTEVSSGTTTISLNTLGEFEAGKTYQVCFAYNNGSWVDDVFQSFVPAAPKHLITATYDKQTRLLEQPLPYATTVGVLYEAVTGESFSDLISTMTALEMTLSGIGSTNTSVVSIGEFNGASTPVTVNADGKAAVALRFGSYAKGIFVSVTPPLYAYVKDGVKDADKWTASTDGTNFGALPIGGLKGDGSETVTLKYNGRLKVKGVKATSEAGAAADDGNGLSKLTADYEAQDGEVLTGTLAANVKITIADGATVTLKDVNINGSGTWTSGNYAGITCAGDATITLEGTNTVKGFADGYPGIFVSSGKTLVINGTGELIASSNGSYDTGSGGAGIGGGDNLNCGNIEIQSGTVTATGNQYGAGIGGGQSANCGNITISGGTVTATGGYRAAGIGGGRRGTSGTKGGYDSGSCGNITISGGTVTATGGQNAAGIGGGRGNNVNYKTSCGTITITSGVTSVTATKGDGADNSIGAGNLGTCGTVTIGGNVGAITDSPYTYQPSN